MDTEAVDQAARIEEGLAQASKLVEDFKDLWSRGQLVDAGGLQVKVLGWRDEPGHQEVRQLRFVLGGNLAKIQVETTDDTLASMHQEQDPEVFIMERAIGMAAERFRQILTDAIFDDPKWRLSG